MPDRTAPHPVNIARTSHVYRGLSGGPCHRAAAQNVGMRVPNGLARLRPGVEYQPVIIYARVGGHLPGLGDQLVQQAAAGLRHCCDVGQVLAWYDQDMNGRLRAYVAERNGPLALEHPVGRQVARNNFAKQAVWHGQILTCGGLSGPPTYMVLLLRTHVAPPLWCAGHLGLPSLWVRRTTGGSGDAIQKWTGMGGSASVGDVDARRAGSVDPL